MWVLVGVTVGSGVVAASSTKSVTVCANDKTNFLRYAKNGKCVAQTETKIVLNQTGADGAKGDSGASGTNGTNATPTISQQSVCDGSDADITANEVCKVGMTGPGGGLIFFVDYNDEYSTYDYLEAAPADATFASSADTGVWATTVAKCGDTAPQLTSCQSATIYTEQGVALATVKGAHRGLFGGKAATVAIVARHEAGSVARNLYAAGVADEYEANGKSDWWLPSVSELEMMLKNLFYKGVGGFAIAVYLSSSEADADQINTISFNSGDSYFPNKVTAYKVRPVRAF